jgi:hypothetical protein
VARTTSRDTNATHAGLQGVCRLPHQQLSCFVADTLQGSCSNQAVDLVTGEVLTGAAVNAS